MNELQKQWESASNAYLVKFAKKHGYKNYEWAGGIVGGVAVLDEYVFADFRDIRYDIDRDVAVGNFEKWNGYCCEIQALQRDYDEVKGRQVLKKVSYNWWCEGVPLPYSKKELSDMRAAQQALLRARLSFLEKIDGTTDACEI